jgi:hypothetical protein
MQVEENVGKLGHCAVRDCLSGSGLMIDHIGGSSGTPVVACAVRFGDWDS